MGDDDDDGDDDGFGDRRFVKADEEAKAARNNSSANCSSTAAKDDEAAILLALPAPTADGSTAGGLTRTAPSPSSSGASQLPLLLPSPVLATAAAEDETTAAAATMKTASSSSADSDSTEMAVAANSRDKPQNQQQQQQTATTEDEMMTTKMMKTASSSSADPDSTEMAVAANSRDEPKNQQQQQTATTEDEMMTTATMKTASSSPADPDSTEMAVAANSRDEPPNQQRRPSTARLPRTKRPRRAPRDFCLHAFRTRRHGLRLSASNIAACAGLHPWKNLPELVQLLVYQGSAGQELLRRDCELLGLQPVADGDQILKDLAQRAGKATAAAVAEALHVQDGTKVVPTVEAAAAMKQKAIREASKSKLISETERKLFAEGVRRCVNTGYGTAHESAGLDLYERQTGWPVRQRNAEIRAWPFRVVNNHNGATVPSVAPMGEAAPLSFRDNKNNSSKNNAPAAAGDEPPPPPPSADEDATAKRSKVIDLTAGEEETEPGNDDNDETDDEKPFFFILGSVDGIRDELAPNHRESASCGSSDDDSSWVLRQVVVECKHRMLKIAVPHPPLYEQIQAVAYCFLYNVQEADLVQILRREKKKPDKKRQRPRTAPDKKEQQPTVLESWLNDDTNAGTDPVNNITALNSPEASHHCVEKKNSTGVSGPANVQSEAAVGPTIDDTPKEPKVPDDDDAASKTDNNSNNDLCSHAVTIAISRISLDDEIMQHGRQWHGVILPRLRSFAEAVYSIRRDDDKRYRLLASLAAESGELMSSSSSTTTAADAGWQLLFEECPWLETCDTAFRNQRA